MKPQLLVALALTSCLIPIAAFAQQTVNGVTMQRGFLGQRNSPNEIAVLGSFKGSKRIAITVFNEAFPDDNHLVAKTSGHSGGFSSSAKADLRTTITGVDSAMRQRIADQAYKTFVLQLTAAGYDVVEPTELTRLAPEYATWLAEPNFSQGRFGTYVAPTGRSLYWWQGLKMSVNKTSAVDYSFSAIKMMISFWKPSFGGFGGQAALQIPVRSDAPFITKRGEEGAIDAAIIADPAKFEAAANDVISQAIPKFVSVMASSR